MKYTLNWVSWVGKSQWAENRLGAGATYGMWKIIGIIIIIVGVLVLFGQIDIAPNVTTDNNQNPATEFNNTTGI